MVSIEAASRNRLLPGHRREQPEGQPDPGVRRCDHREVPQRHQRLSRVGRKNRESPFVRDNCKIPSKVLHEARRSRTSRCWDPQAPRERRHLEPRQGGNVDGSTRREELDRPLPRARERRSDPGATALDAIARSEETLLGEDWQIVTDDEASGRRHLSSILRPSALRSSQSCSAGRATAPTDVGHGPHVLPMRVRSPPERACAPEGCTAPADSRQKSCRGLIARAYRPDLGD